MSLQLLAKQMEAKGREGDSMLVHMTPGEVEGLQKLAESMGESLTVNPETGLVEAFKLKELFPVLAGAALTVGTGGAAAPWMVGLGVGGLEALRTGNMKKGLLAGMGAYGGAGLAGGLMGAGSQAAQAGAMRTAADVPSTAAATTSNAAANVAPGAMRSGFVGASAGDAAGELTAQQALAAQQNAAQAVLQQEAKAQAIEQARLKAAENYAAKGAFDRIGGGLKAMVDPSSNVGRDAFMKDMGGYSGLAKNIGMAAAPLLVPEERKMAKAPVDNELYYYDYNPGRTGAERIPVASSAERLQLAGGYSPREIINADDYEKRRNRSYLAAQGGLLSLAEGGETVADAATTADAPTASEAALSYLMGERSSSSAGLPAMAAQTPASTTPNLVVGSDNMYAFDPATGVFVRNPNYVDPMSGKRNAGLIGSLISGGSGGSNAVESPNPDWDKKTPAEKQAWYAEHPMTANLVGIAQSAFGATPLGKLQSYLDPEGVAANRAMISQAPADVVNRYGMADAFPGQTSSFLDPQQRAQQQAESNSGGGGATVGGGAEGSISSGMSQSDMMSAQEAGMWKQGGITSLAKGGMASGGFVVPADVVSALGNGSTDAGLRALYAMLGKIKPIKGKGDGLSDSIPTHIDGKQRARVADGEAYIDPKTVKRLGGAKKLYAMMDKVRAQAHGKTTQQRKVNPAKVMA